MKHKKLESSTPMFETNNYNGLIHFLSAIEMKLNYKTGSLPPNFIYLGIMLLAVGLWRMVVLDWKGILFFVISLLLLFIRSGIMIDPDKKRLKKYIGFFAIKNGEWESIKTITNLQITKTRETQAMSVLSITRMETNEVYKLFVILPKRNLEIMSGKKADIAKKAGEISSVLQVPLIYRTR